MVVTGLIVKPIHSPLVKFYRSFFHYLLITGFLLLQSTLFFNLDFSFCVKTFWFLICFLLPLIIPPKCDILQTLANFVGSFVFLVSIKKNGMSSVCFYHFFVIFFLFLIFQDDVVKAARFLVKAARFLVCRREVWWEKKSKNKEIGTRSINQSINKSSKDWKLAKKKTWKKRQPECKSVFVRPFRSCLNRTWTPPNAMS